MIAVGSYNIWAQGGPSPLYTKICTHGYESLTDSEKIAYDSYSRPWDERKKTLISNIVEYGLDIVALQEVEKKAFDDLASDLTDYGYQSVGGWINDQVALLAPLSKDDGMAIFYRPHHLVPVETSELQSHTLNQDFIGDFRVIDKLNSGCGKVIRFVACHLDKKLYNAKETETHLTSILNRVTQCKDRCDGLIIAAEFKESAPLEALACAEFNSLGLLFSKGFKSHDPELEETEITTGHHTDWLFYKSAIELKKISTIGQMIASDHRLVAAKVDFLGPSSALKPHAVLSSQISAPSLHMEFDYSFSPKGSVIKKQSSAPVSFLSGSLISSSSIDYSSRNEDFIDDRLQLDGKTAPSTILADPAPSKKKSYQSLPSFHLISHSSSMSHYFTCVLNSFAQSIALLDFSSPAYSALVDKLHAIIFHKLKAPHSISVDKLNAQIQMELEKELDLIENGTKLITPLLNKAMADAEKLRSKKANLSCKFSLGQSATSYPTAPSSEPSKLLGDLVGEHSLGSPPLFQSSFLSDFPVIPPKTSYSGSIQVLSQKESSNSCDYSPSSCSPNPGSLEKIHSSPTLPSSTFTSTLTSLGKTPDLVLTHFANLIEQIPLKRQSQRLSWRYTIVQLHSLIQKFMQDPKIKPLDLWYHVKEKFLPLLSTLSNGDKQLGPNFLEALKLAQVYEQSLINPFCDTASLQSQPSQPPSPILVSTSDSISLPSSPLAAQEPLMPPLTYLPALKQPLENSHQLSNDRFLSTYCPSLEPLNPQKMTLDLVAQRQETKESSGASQEFPLAPLMPFYPSSFHNKPLHPPIPSSWPTSWKLVTTEGVSAQKIRSILANWDVKSFCDKLLWWLGDLSKSVLQWLRIAGKRPRSR